MDPVLIFPPRLFSLVYLQSPLEWLFFANRCSRPNLHVNHEIPATSVFQRYLSVNRNYILFITYCYNRCKPLFYFWSVLSRLLSIYRVPVQSTAVHRHQNWCSSSLRTRVFLRSRKTQTQLGVESTTLLRVKGNRVLVRPLEGVSSKPKVLNHPLRAFAMPNSAPYILSSSIDLQPHQTVSVLVLFGPICCPFSF